MPSSTLKYNILEDTERENFNGISIMMRLLMMLMMMLL